MIMFSHPTKDGACGGFPGPDPSTNNHIWSHRYVLLNEYVTKSAAHEFGHALSLPDLYDTKQVTQGDGEWGLMGSGNFSSPRSPSRMEAWSLNELGWITLLPLTSAGTYPLDPVALSRTAAYVRPPGPNPRGEYFLIENRQGGSAGLADSAMIARHCRRS